MKSARTLTGTVSRSLPLILIAVGISSASAIDTTGAEKLRASVESFSDFLLKYFVALAAVGALAMALLEFWKKVRDSRTRFHAKTITEWVKGSQHPDAYPDLLHLTTGMDIARAHKTAKDLYSKQGSLPHFLGISWRLEDALFSLELEQMLGHVQDACDIALNNPSDFPNLYLFATQGGNPEDIANWEKMAEVVPVGDHFDANDSKRRADVYTRLHQIAKRKLDAFQLYAGREWTNWNQLWSNILGALVMFACLLWMRTEGEWNASWINILVLSVFGGILSPVAKDVVVALKKVRGG